MAYDSGLEYDDLGFLVSLKRIDRKLTDVDKNISEILKIMRMEFQNALIENQNRLIDVNQNIYESTDLLNNNLSDLSGSVSQLNRDFIEFDDLIKTHAAIENGTPVANEDTATILETGTSSTTIDLAANSINQEHDETINSSDSSARNKNRNPQQAADTQDTTIVREVERVIDSDTVSDTPEEPNTTTRVRDSRGRFIGKNGSTDDGSEKKGFSDNFLTKITDSKSAKEWFKTIFSTFKGGQIDSKGVDPTVDAMNELGTLLSPVGKAAQITLKPLTGLFKNKKRAEPLPKEQADHNKRIERTLQSIDNKSGKGLTLASITKIIPMLALALGGVITGSLLKGMPSTDEIKEGAGQLWSDTKDGAKSLWSDTKDGAKNLWNKATGNSVGATAQTPKGKQHKNMMNVYDALISEGFTHNQAVGIVGDVGREGDFLDANIFGKHNDPARGKNIGMVSWNDPKRKAGLIKFLSERGLMNKDGTIQNSEAGIKGQVAYMKKEIMANPKWKKNIWDNKDISVEEAREVLGGRGTYFGWARKQNTVKDNHGNRIPFNWKRQERKANGYSVKINEEIQKRSSSRNEKSSSTTANTSNQQEISKHKTENVTASVVNSDNKVNTKQVTNTSTSTSTSTNAKGTTNSVPTTPIVFNSNQVVKPKNSTITKSSNYSEFINNQMSRMPKMEQVKERLSSSDPKKVIVANQGSGSDMISQNISDRNLAHALTGGIGMGQSWDI